jgi:dolichyl-phosphate-mannose-protein mannosyltransferase
MKVKFCVLTFVIANLFFCGAIFSETNAVDKESSVNLAQNGDFEDVVANMPRFWNFDAWIPETTVTKIISEENGAYSGNRFITIENIKTNDARLVQDITVKPLTVYLISCNVKVSNAIARDPGSPKKDLPLVGANICVILGNSDFAPPHLENTSGKWQYLEYPIKTGPEQVSLRVAIRLGYFGSDLTGKASFDDFRIVEVKNPMNFSPVSVGVSTQATTSGGGKDSPIGLIMLIAIAALLAIGITVFIVLSGRSRKKASKNKTGQPTGIGQGEQLSEVADAPLLLGKQTANFTKIDIMIVAGMMIVYSLIAFTNLGSNEAPETYWRPVTKGEGVTVDFGSEQLIKRIYFWEGLPGGSVPNESKYEIEGSVDGETWTHLALLNPKTVFWWYFESVNSRARYVRLTTEVPGSWLNEVVFLGEDTANPIKIEKIIPGDRQALSEGSVYNLFDEYSNVGEVKHKKQLVYRPQIMTGMSPGFDEQYHGRTALEILNFRSPYEWTHPPLGKLLIATGVLIFGMNPFGWRFMGAFFGLLIIPLMFAFGKRLFKKTEYGFIAAFLMMFDFMHFTQSRIATIDTYPVFFIILTFYFMYRYCEMSYLKTDFNKLLLPLLLSGIAWGLGAASKWTALYAFIGLAVMFFVNLYTKSKEIREARLSKSIKKDKDEWEKVQTKIDDFTMRAWQLVGWSVLVFVVIPAIIYGLAYVPTLMAKDIHFNIGYIFDNNVSMFNYHSKLEATHSYSSRWWEWPPMTKPMAYYFAEGLPEGQTQRLFAFGNPAVWWVGSLAILGVLLIGLGAFIKRITVTSAGAASNVKFSSLFKMIVRNGNFTNPARFFIITGFATVYLPWVISPRQLLFIYHYFPSVPFIIFAIVYLIKLFRDKALEPMKETNKAYKLYSILGNGLIYLYLAVAMILFFMFYPVIAGVPAPTEYIIKWLKWFPNNWYFG